MTRLTNLDTDLERCIEVSFALPVSWRKRLAKALAHSLPPILGWPETITPVMTVAFFEHFCRLMKVPEMSELETREYVLTVAP